MAQKPMTPPDGSDQEIATAVFADISEAVRMSAHYIAKWKMINRPKIEALVTVAREVVKVSGRMKAASVGGLGELETMAREALEAWDAEM